MTNLQLRTAAAALLMLGLPALHPDSTEDARAEQIWRCGNSYSTTPCTNGHVVEARPDSNVVHMPAPARETSSTGAAGPGDGRSVSTRAGQSASPRGDGRDTGPTVTGIGNHDETQPDPNAVIDDGPPRRVIRGRHPAQYPGPHPYAGPGTQYGTQWQSWDPGQPAWCCVEADPYGPGYGPGYGPAYDYGQGSVGVHIRVPIPGVYVHPPRAPRPPQPGTRPLPPSMR